MIQPRIFPPLRAVLLGVCLSVSVSDVVPAQDLTLSILGAVPIKQFERIEFVGDGLGAYANPGDPAQIQVDLELTGPTGAPRRVPAFWHQAYEFRALPQGNRSREWMYPVGQPQWRARFAPDQAGRYEAVLVAQDGGGGRRSPAVGFTVLAGESKGFVKVSTRDSRFFEFSDGTPFFPLGQNVAFVGLDQYLNTERAAGVFEKMARHGANFARVWVCAEDWALGIEARKSAWGRSWGWNPPFVPLPGPQGYHGAGLCARLGGGYPANVTLAPPHPVALRPATEYTLSGQVLTDADTEFQIELEGLASNPSVRSDKRGQWVKFTRALTAASNQWWLGRLTLRAAGDGSIWLRDLSLREATGGPELLADAAPRLAARGFYDPLDGYMLDRLLEAAERHGVYLQLCLFTRDHYMHDLRDPASAAYQQAIDDARKLLRYAVARWGASTHVFAWEYFNEMDPGAPTQKFHQALGEYLARHDPYRHLRTTSGWGPAPAHWTHPELDIADLHHYLRPNAPPAWTNEVAAVLERAALVRQHAGTKPAVLGEFGLADEKWGRSPYMKQDQEGVHFHNALWASAFSGLSGTAMFWWWETLDQMDAYPHYGPLARFLAGIPWTTGQLAAADFLSDRSRCRVLAWRGPERADCWITNPQATWWSQVVGKQTPARVAGDSFTLAGLAAGTYRIQWWDTRSGTVTREETARVTDGQLQVAVPEFTRDIACKVEQSARAR